MKRQTQEPDYSKYSGTDLVNLQAELYKMLEGFPEKPALMIVSGCQVLEKTIAPGVVVLPQTAEGKTEYKIAVFKGATVAEFPVYLDLCKNMSTDTSDLAAYEYEAIVCPAPATGIQGMVLKETGNRTLTDAIREKTERFVTAIPYNEENKLSSESCNVCSAPVNETEKKLADTQSTPVVLAETGYAELAGNNTFTGSNKFIGNTITFDSSNKMGDIFSVNGFMMNQWASNKPAYTWFTASDSSNWRWVGIGSGTDEHTIKMGHCSWNISWINEADIKLEINGDITAKSGTFSKSLNVTGGILSSTLSHNSGANLLIGNSANSNYVEFVEDVKFNKNTTFYGTNNFSGTNTFSGTAAFNNKVTLNYETLINTTTNHASITSSGAVWNRIYFYKSVIPYGNGFYSGIRIDTDQDILLNTYSKAGNGVTTAFHVGQGRIHSSGAITAAGSITPNYGSDRRLKDNIMPLTQATDTLKALKIYEFDYTDAALRRDVGLQKHSFGMMYDEITDTRLSNIGSVSEDGYGAINYNSPSLISMMLAGEVELINKFESIETEQQRMEKRINSLEEEVSFLKSMNRN